MTTIPSTWFLALESSTPYGGVALVRDGVPVDAIRLEEGLRHGRELVSSAGRLLERHSLAPGDLRGIAVSAGPGSYTGIRVGVMAAKALAYGAGAAMVDVSSLAALAQSVFMNSAAAEGDVVCALQDARRDEVYAGVYRITNSAAAPLAPDGAITPEEAAERLRGLEERFPGKLRLAGSAFATYREVLSAGEAAEGRVDPCAVGVLAWKRFLLGETADPMQAQPVYLRRDEGADWRHDQLISG